jgi:hypothetical protein
MSDLQAIGDGLTRGELFVEYIPTIDLDSGCCVGGLVAGTSRRLGRVAL